MLRVRSGSHPHQSLQVRENASCFVAIKAVLKRKVEGEVWTLANPSRFFGFRYLSSVYTNPFYTNPLMW